LKDGGNRRHELGRRRRNTIDVVVRDDGHLARQTDVDGESSAQVARRMTRQLDYDGDAFSIDGLDRRARSTGDVPPTLDPLNDAVSPAEGIGSNTIPNGRSEAAPRPGGGSKAREMQLNSR
jgi:hypothetical protein